MTQQPLSPLRSPLAPLGVLALTLALSACGGGPASQAPAQTSAAQPPVDFVYDGKDHSWSSSGGQGGIKAQAITSGDNNLSFEAWSAATNAWGPIERDRSNGEKNAGDGRTLSIGGQTYAQGFGVHAGSSMTFQIGGQCTSFTATVGVDDEVGDRGSVVFQIYGDGVKLYDSGVMRGSDGSRALSVNVAGKNELKLVVTDAGDGLDYDHADWTNTMLRSCGGASFIAPAPPSGGNVQYSGKLVITKGGTYSGNWESTDTGTAVFIQTTEPVIIENSNIRGRGHLIHGFRNRLTIRNTRGYGLNSNVLGRPNGFAVAAEDLLSLRVENSYFENTGGIYMRGYYGDPSKGDTIKILHNKIRNVNGTKSDGNGGYLTSSTIVQAMLFNGVRRVPGVEIAWNEIVNEPGKSATEENINVYGSSGTPESPMLIHDNYIQGAYAVDPVDTTAYAGGGILLGDGKVTDPRDSGYTRVYNNHIVSTTNHGVAIAGGVSHQAYNNRVLSSGRLPDGRRIAAANVGLYVWDSAGAGKLTPPTFANNVMRDNVVGWTRVGSDGRTSNNPMWLPNCGLNNTVCTGNQDMGTVTLDMERQEFTRWQNKVASAGVKVGP